MPIYRHLPKRGFKNIHRVEVHVVQVERLNAADPGSLVDGAWLREKRLVRGPGPVKILAGGELKHAVKLRVDAISAGARKVVEAVGGSIELIEPRPKYIRGGAKDASSKNARQVSAKPVATSAETEA
jgi:large subunit ribosomal protein L15